MKGEWQGIDTAPKSTFTPTPNGSNVQGMYILGFCPEIGIPHAACVTVIWWEPLVRSVWGGKGCWFGQGAVEVEPTHWMPLPVPPESD